jgi:hypothetical protein
MFRLRTREDCLPRRSRAKAGGEGFERKGCHLPQQIITLTLTLSLEQGEATQSSAVAYRCLHIQVTSSPHYLGCYIPRFTLAQFRSSR